MPLTWIVDGTPVTAESVNIPLAELLAMVSGGAFEIVVYENSGTFSKDNYPSATQLVMILVGGNASGSTPATLAQTGSGGGSGGFCLDVIPFADLGSSEAVFVGTGGASATAGGSAGNPGGTTSFAGRVAGGGNPGGNPNIFNQGGIGGSASGGKINARGNAGTAGGNVAGVPSGAGASSALGGGTQGRMAQANQPSVDGGRYGAGNGATHPSQPSGAGYGGVAMFILI